MAVTLLSFRERRYVTVIGDASAYPDQEPIAVARAARCAETQGQQWGTRRLA